MSDFDCVIVGCGMAGASAADVLCRQGYSVVMVEARERLGGRSLFRPFAGSNDGLDFGGGWITPWQKVVRQLCKEYGVPLVPRNLFTQRRWFRDGALHVDGATSADERYRHEAVIARIGADSIALQLGHRVDELGRPIADVSFNDYVKRLDAPQATVDLLSAWWTVSGGGDKRKISISALLSSCRHCNGFLEAIAEGWAESLTGGVQALVEAIVTKNEISVRTGSAVIGLDDEDYGVTVAFADNSMLRASSAIVATGINPMKAISFKKLLPGEMRMAINIGHLGRVVKVWAKVRNVSVGVLATGGTGIEWMLSTHTVADGSTMVVGFGVAANGWEPDLPGDVEAAVRGFYPEAEFISADWHDWVDDTFAQGTWAPGQCGADAWFTHDFWAPRSRVAFASSDFAARESGWFEGAAISGQDAARAVLGMIGKRQRNRLPPGSHLR